MNQHPTPADSGTPIPWQMLPSVGDPVSSLWHRLRRGSFHNVKELIQAIQDYISGHNQNPRVFVWSASVERILTKVAKCKEALDALH